MGSLREEYERRWVSGRDFNKSNATLRQQLDMDQDQRRAYLEWEQQTNEQNRLKTQAETQSKIFGNYADKYNSFSDQLKSFDQNAGGMLRAGTGGYYHSPDAYNSTLSELDKLKNTGEYLKYPWSLVQSADPDNASGLPSPTEITRYVADMTDLAESQRDYYGQYKSPGQYYSRPMVPEVTQREPEGPINPNWRQDYLKPDAKLPEDTQSIARGGKLGSDVKYTNWTQPQLSDDEQKAQLARGEEYSQYASGVPDNAKPAWQVTGTAGISLYKPDAFMEREIAYKKWKDNENSPYKTPVYVDVLKSSGQWETMPAAQRITAMKLGYQDEAKKYGKQIDGLGLRDRDGRVAEITYTLDYEQPTAEVQLALQEERTALLSGDLEETYSDLNFRREGAEKLAKKYETLEGWQKFDQKYQYVWNNADFVDLSGYDANKLKPGNPASQYYEYLNAGPERKRELESATTVPVFSLSGFMSPTVMESNIRLKGIDELDADEILVFNYLYNKKGADAAMEYLDGKGTELLSRRALTRQQRMEEMTENSLELASLATLYWQMENAVTGPVQFVAGMLGTDPNDPIFDRQSDVVTVRSKAGQVLDQVYGNAMIPILNVPVASTLYNAGMSAGDSLIGRALGAVVGYQGLNRLMMTSRVLGSEMQNSLKEGDSIGMSVFRGLSAAIIENVTESLGDKAFYGNPRSVALYLAQNFFAEGSEEFLANLGNTMVELAAKGTESEIYHKALDAAHKRGWSRETAQSFAFKEWLREAGTDFLTGSLMGLMSGVAGAPGQQSRVNQVKTNEAYDAIMADEGIKYSPKDKASLGLGELLQGDTPTTIESALKPAEARTEGYDRAEQATTPYTQAQRQRDIALSRLGKTTQGDVGTQMANASVLDQAATWSNEQRLAALAEQESELEIRLAYGDKLDEAQAGLDSAQEGYAQAGESLDSIDSELAELRQRLDDLKALQNAELESPEATQEIDRAESKMAEIQTLLDRSTPTEQLPGAKAEAEAAEPVSKQAALQTQLDTAEPVEQVPGQAPETGTADDRRTRLESQGIAAGSVEQFRQELESVDPESPDALERIAEIQKRMDMAGIKRAEEAQIPYHGRNISYKRENIPDIQEHRAKNPELNDEAFDFAAEAAYGAGLSGSKTLFEVSAAIKDLAPETAKALFDAGLGVYNAKAGERHALRQRMKDYMPKPGQGKLIIPKEVIQKMNPEQKKLAADLQKFIIMAGVEGDLFASETADESGRILSEEGSFDPSTGRFRFDINAGINFVAELKNKARGAVEFALPRVIGHEFTHYLKTTAPELYAVYQDAVIKELSAKNQLDDLILTELGRARKGALSIGVALEEVVARSSEMMLRDTQFMQNVMGEKPNLWDKFKAWVADFIKGIQERMKGMNPAYAGAKSLIETGNGIVKYAGNLQTLWDRAMEDSIRYRMDAPVKPKTAPISPVGVVKDETLASLADGQNAANIAGNEGAARAGGEQMKFSAREPVEEVGNLIAVHNLGAQQMQEVLRLGGFAMPSIAVLKAGTEHSRYGDISVVFGKETIDPVRDPRNKIYGGDAYTPSFPQINYEISGDNTAAVRKKVSELLGELYKPFAIQISDDSIKRAADNNRGSFADAYENEPGLMGAYLKSIGEDFIPHSSEPEYAPWSGIGNQAIKYLADKMGRELQAAYNKPFDEKMAMEPAIRGVINEYFEQEYSDTLSKKQIKEMGAEEYGFNKIDEIIRGVGEYLKTKGAVRLDKYETGKMLRDRFEQDNHLPAYRAWLTELFAGAIAKSGIRNNADIFTPSGNRRSFDATHWQVTLDNIVRAMKAENSKGADGWASSNLFGVATKNFKSIADVRRDADRLRQMDDEAYKAEKDEFQERLVELASEIATKKEPNRFIAIDRAAEALTDAARAGTKAGMQRILNEYRDYHNIKADTAEKLDALIKDIMKMPTEYFEAKPERAVGLEEMRAVIHPNTTSKSLIDWMERKGVRRLEYEAGNEQDRLAKLNSIEDVRFSERPLAPPMYSKMAQEIEAYKGDKMGAESIIPYLRGKGVKADEIRWSGIQTFLQGKKSVSKAELLEFARGNELRVEDVTKEERELATASNSRIEREGDLYSLYVNNQRVVSGHKDYFRGMSRRDIDTELREMYNDRDTGALRIKSDPKYDRYTLPGGTNYRELLFTAPDLDGTFQSSHWDEENVLAHARLQDFQTTDGKPVLFIEEVQSDWHEKGREKGYSSFTKDDLKELEKLDKISREVGRAEREEAILAGKSISDAADIRIAAAKAWFTSSEGLRYAELQQKSEANLRAVSPAPFTDTWHEFVLKRVLRMAAEGDYDYVAWTTGKMQADRYWGNAVISDAVDRFVEVTKPESIRVLADDIFGSKMAGLMPLNVMDGGMLTAAKNDKVRDVIISSLPVDVVDILSTVQLSAKDIFSNKNVVFDNLPVDSRTRVASAVLSTLRDTGATISTKLEGLRLGGGEIFLYPALKASDLNSREVAGLLNPQTLFHLDTSTLPKEGTSTGAITKSLPRQERGSPGKNLSTTKLAELLNAHVSIIHDNEGLVKHGFEAPPGEGMRSFYDIGGKSSQNIPRFLNKYAGQWGAKVQTIKMDKHTVPAVEVTEKMRDSVLYEGQPLYAERDHDNSLPSARAILAGAFGQVAQTTAEKENVEKYRKNADRYNRLEGELNNLLEKRKQLYRDKAPQSEKNELRADINALRDKLDKADRVLLNLQMSKPLRDVVAREVDKAYGAYQEKAAERVAQARQGMRDTGVRGKIRNVYLRLMKALANPTEKQYVPAQYVRPLIDIAEAIDVSGKSVNLAEKIAKFKERYEALKTDTDYSLSSEFDESILNEIKALQKEIGATLPINLKGEQLERLYKVLRAVETTLMNARKLIASNIAKTNYEAAEQIIGEVRAAKGVGFSRLSNFLLRFTTGMLDARRAARLLTGYAENGMLERLIAHLNEGQLMKNNFIMQGSRLFDFLTAGKENAAQLRNFTGREAKWIATGIKDAQGHELKITPAMRASLYMHTLNDDNLRHLLGGGITMPAIDLYKQGRFAEAFKRGNTFRLTEDQIKKILAGMTAYEKAWVKAAQAFFAYSTEKINETSMQLVGYKKAMVQNYFPIQSDHNFLRVDFESIARDGSIEGMGFLKERVGSTNPMYLMDITSVLDRQLNNTAKYVGLAIPVRNFNKVYRVSAKGYVDSVQKALNQMWGDKATKYLENLMADIQDARKNPPTFFDKAKGRFAQSVLALNPSVSLKQAASYPTAAAVLGWKPLMKALGRGGKKGTPLSRADQELIAKYTPLLWMRTKGMSTTELGDIRAMKPEFGAISKLSEAAHKYLLNWIQQIDTATVGRLWYAAQYNIDAARPDLEKGSDAYYQEVAKLFNRAVEETQPDYTVMQRPDILRNPNAVIRGMTMFMTQRLQNFGILYDAAGELMETGRKLKADPKNEALKSQRERAGKQLNRAIFSQAVSALVLSLMTLLGKAVLHRPDEYRDEDNQLVLGSIVEQVARDVPSILLGMVVGGAEMYETALSLLTGKRSYGLQFSPIEFINDLKTSFDNLLMEVNKTVAEGKDPKRLIDSASKVAMQALTFLGMPVNNAKKIVDGVYLHYKDFEDGAFGSFKAGKAGIDKRTAYANFVEAFTAGDQVRMDLLMKELQDAEVTESGIKSGIRAAIKANFEAGKINRETYIQQVVDATDYDDVKNDIIKQWFTAGEIDEAEAKRLLQKFTADDEPTEQFKTLERWKHEPENDEDSYRILKKFLDAVRTGKNLRAVVTEYTDPNKYAYDSNYLAGQITTAFKQEYIDNPAQRSKLKGYILNAYSLLGYDRDKKSKDIDSWLRQYTDEDFEKAIETGANMKAVLDEYVKYSTAKDPKKTIANRIGGIWAKPYAKLTPGQRALLKPKLLDAYVYLGYTRSERSDYIDRWVTNPY